METPVITMWRDRRIEDLSREELLDVVRQLFAMYSSHITPRAIRERSIGSAELMRRGWKF